MRDVLRLVDMICANGSRLAVLFLTLTLSVCQLSLSKIGTLFKFRTIEMKKKL